MIDERCEGSRADRVLVFAAYKACRARGRMLVLAVINPKLSSSSPRAYMYPPYTGTGCVAAVSVGYVTQMHVYVVSLVRIYNDVFRIRVLLSVSRYSVLI